MAAAEGWVVAISVWLLLAPGQAQNTPVPLPSVKPMEAKEVAGAEKKAGPAEKKGSVAQITAIGILPGFKRGESVPEDERNPYANRVLKKEKPAENGSEAAKIIQVLESLRMRGQVRDESGKVKTVLLGDLALAEGRILPQLLPAQVDEIYVSKVTNEEVEIAWRTDSGKVVPDGRRVALKLDGRPKVEVILPGQPDVGEKEKLRALLVAKPTEEGRPE